MTRQLIIHLPQECLALISDNVEGISFASDFCKKELSAYHTTENIDELTVDSITKEQDEKLHSLLFEKGLL